MPQPGLSETSDPLRAAPFFAHVLILLSLWTLIIKFVLPVAFALEEGAPIGRYIMWDFWWVAHLTLAWGLLRRPAWLFAAGVVIAAVEIVIVVTKFILFLPAPDWTIWTMNWFVNKIFVLGIFSLMLPWLLANRAALTGRSGAREPEGAS